MSRPVPIDRVHGGDAPSDVIDFSASINPLGPPPAAIAAYHEAAARISSYPPPRSAALEKRLAQWMEVGEDKVLAGNGTTQLIYLMARVLEPAHPFVAIPTFSEIANALAGEGWAPEAIRLAPDDFRLEIGRVQEALADHAGAIFFGRPNSPTGTMPTVDDVREIADRCARRACWCVVDEAFIDLADPPDSVVKLVNVNPRLVVLRSLTKSFAIAGLRLGCVIADDEVIAAMRQAIEPWSVNVVAESVGLACIEAPEDYLRRSREFIAREREYLAVSLSAIAGIRVFPSAANFLMIAVQGESEPGEFAAAMLERKIAVRDLATMPGCSAGHYRIAVRTRPDNERLVAAARDWRAR